MGDQGAIYSRNSRKEPVKGQKEIIELSLSLFKTKKEENEVNCKVHTSNLISEKNIEQEFLEVQKGDIDFYRCGRT